MFRDLKYGAINGKVGSTLDGSLHASDSIRLARDKKCAPIGNSVGRPGYNIWSLIVGIIENTPLMYHDLLYHRRIL